MSFETDKLLRKEIAKIDAIVSIQARDIRNEEWSRYWDCFNELPESARSLVAYEICKRVQSRGTCGFHGFARSKYNPISFLGWADCDEKKNDQGVGFRINRDCFTGRNVELYYVDDDMFESIDSDSTHEWLARKLNKMLEKIKTFSSGIDDVRIHEEIVEAGFIFRRRKITKRCKMSNIRFRLEPAKIRETVSFSGKEVPSSEVGGYIFVLPRAGEFFCELGEIVDGKRVALHIDDFCMK